MKNLSLHKHGQNIDRAFLFSALQSKNCVLLESARQDELNRKNLLFVKPVEILTATAHKDIPIVFEKIEQHLSAGKYLAGYFSYECGYHFERVVERFENTLPVPLIWLGVYEEPFHIPFEVIGSASSESNYTKDPSHRLSNIEFQISKSSYEEKIREIKNYILNGDTYQVNFTDRFDFEFDGNAIDLYFALREKQHVPYSAFIRMESGDILSFSPELFFRRSGDRIMTKPMKGTSKRGRTLNEDAHLAEWLQHDEKNRSENLMIVDLLRNDIGRICETGSVQVSAMFAVERYETVLQMTSTISGTLKHNTQYYDIFKSLFPCGSVTGAPKIRTMQIIRELEQRQRGVYCGAIGYFSPEKEAVFNVGIRTVILQHNKGTMGVGSGIVFDSDADKEMEECTLKANFLLKEQPDFRLLETMLWSGMYSFFEEHLQRMKRSAEYFFIPFDESFVRELLSVTEKQFGSGKQYRIRLLVSKRGIPNIECEEFFPVNDDQGNVPVIKIAREKIDSSDPFYFHKTTNRQLYSRYRELAHNENIADYIFMNERNEITEGTITNIFIEKNGALFTPPIECGILNGIYRQHILSTKPNTSEKIITMSDIYSAHAIFLCNSVRGMTKVTLSE